MIELVALKKTALFINKSLASFRGATSLQWGPCSSLSECVEAALKYC